MGGPKQIRTIVNNVEVETAAPTQVKQLKVGESLILNYNGNELALKNLIDSNPIVILKFTAQWCSPCLVAEKSLIRLAREKDSSLDGVLVVSIEIDSGPNGYKSYSRNNILALKYNTKDGKATTGNILYVNGQRREWSEFPYVDKESWAKLGNLGEKEEEISERLHNIKNLVKKE